MKEMTEEQYKSLDAELHGFIMRSNITAGAFERLVEIGYLEAPASRGHHLVERGGLAKHSKNVTRRLIQLTESLDVKWPREESPYLVGLFHDLVKCKCYIPVDDENQNEQPKWKYVHPEYPGHGAASALIACDLGIELRREERIAITYHMGAFGVGKEYSMEEFNAALLECPQQIVATCCADWWAARVDEEGVQ